MSEDKNLQTDAHLAWRRFFGVGIVLLILAFLILGVIGLAIADALTLFYIWHKRNSDWYKDNMGSILLSVFCINTSLVLYLNNGHSVLGSVIFLFGVATHQLSVPKPEN